MISFIYFDLGGVVELDFSGTNKWGDLKTEIGLKPNQFEEFDKYWDQFSDINTTRDMETLKPLLENKFGIKFPSDYSLLVDGFVNRFEKNESIWPVIDEIHKYCKIGLLTNMYKHILDAIKKRKIIPDLDWDVVVDSSVVGLQKPDREIFEQAEKMAKTDHDQILFIDNTERNIEAARDFGWQTFLYDTSNSEKASQDLLDFFRKNK